MQIDGHDLRHSPFHRIAAGEDAAIGGAVADGHHPFRVGRRVVGAQQRLAHVLGDRARHQQHVGMARRGDEFQPEALEIVEGVVQRVDLELAAIARAGVDLADGEAAAKPALRRAIEIGGKLGEPGNVGRGRRLGHRPAQQIFQHKPAHARPLEVVARIGAVERFVAEREVGDDVAFDAGLEQRPLKPGRVAQMAALDPAVSAEAHPHEKVAAKGLDQGKPLAGAIRFAELSVDRAVRQALHDLLDQPEALLDLADADPHARIDVAVVAHRHLEIELIVRRIGHRFPRIEGAARGAADIAASAEGARQRRRKIAGGHGAVLQRGGVVVDRDQLGELAADCLDQRRNAVERARGHVLGDAAGDDAVAHQAMAKTGVCRAQHALAQDGEIGLENGE